MDRSALVVVAVASLLAACAESPDLAPPGLAGAPPLPGWQVGDSVSWSSGRTETVIAIEGELVRWRDQDGASFTAYRNFVLPMAEWEDAQTKATATTDAKPDALWPLKAGARTEFQTVLQLARKEGGTPSTITQRWACQVDGTEKISVLLGSFDTWKLRCRQASQDGAAGEVSWNYSPELGQVVRRSEGGEADELVALGHGLPGAKAERVADRVRQKGLEALVSGRKAIGKYDDIEAMVQPRASFVTDKGTTCRDFVQTLNTAKARTTSVGSACRDVDGRWVVVDRMRKGD